MDFKEQVKKGFQSCKSDIEVLAQENQELKSNLSLLQNNNDSLKQELSEIKSMLHSFQSQLGNISENLFQAKPIHIEPQVKIQKEESNGLYSSAKSKPQTIPTQTLDPYEALLAFKAKTNKRDMLKQKMMQMVSENGMNLAELKFMIVDHFRYCSKATFYNYLKELELERQIRIEREHGKNVVFLSGMRKEI